MAIFVEGLGIGFGIVAGTGFVAIVVMLFVLFFGWLADWLLR